MNDFQNLSEWNVFFIGQCTQNASVYSILIFLMNFFERYTVGSFWYSVHVSSNCRSGSSKMLLDKKTPVSCVTELKELKSGSMHQVYIQNPDWG